MHAFDETTFYNDKSWKSSLTENEKFDTPETGGKLIRRYYKAFAKKGTYKSRYSMKMIVGSLPSSRMSKVMNARGQTSTT